MDYNCKPRSGSIFIIENASWNMRPLRGRTAKTSIRYKYAIPSGLYIENQNPINELLGVSCLLWVVCCMF